MNFLPVKYVSVIFGNFQDITPQPSVVEKLFPRMIKLGLMPSTVTNEFDISKQQFIQSLKFADAKNIISIFFRGNAINIEMLPMLSAQNNDLDYFTKTVKQIVNDINTEFIRQFNRLSLVVTYLDNSMSTENKDAMYNKLFPSTTPIFETPPYEWSHRLVSRGPIIINDKNEICNEIVTLLRGNSQQMISNPFQLPVKTNRIELTIDNNTIPESTGFRFDITDFDKFIEITIEKQKNIYKKILERITQNG